MNPSELLLTAKKIAENHVGSGSDLNDAITKVASERNLSKPQIERLVEETNKATFLDLLEKKGEQEFPVADYDTVKSKLAPKIEKNASAPLSFDKLTYSDVNFKDSLGTDHIAQVIEKVAGEEIATEDEIAYITALLKVGQEFNQNYDRFMELEALGQKRYGYKHQDASDLVKIAEVHNDQEILELESLDKTLDKQAAVIEVILEKCALLGPVGRGIGKIVWGNTNITNAVAQSIAGPKPAPVRAAIGASLNKIVRLGVKAGTGTVGTVAKAGLAMGGAALPLVPLAAKASLNTAFTTVEQGGKAIRGTRNALTGHNFVGTGLEAVASDLTKEAGVLDLAKGLFKNPILGAAGSVLNAVKPVASIGTKLASVNKEAGFMQGLQQALEFITPAVVYNATPGGMLGGIAAAAAKKLGGGIAITMNRKEFDNSFDTIMKNNPELADNKKQVRGYFDVISRHAPSLAKDPLVAESIVKNMNAFGGVDYNTVRGLRETESLSSSGPSEKGLSGLTPMFGRS